TSDSMRSAAGHPTIVSTIPTVAVPSSATETERTMSSSVMGLRISGSMTRVSASRISAERSLIGGRLGSRLTLCLVTFEFFEQGAQLGANEVFAREVFHEQPQGDDLAGEVLGVGEVALRALAVLLDLHAVAVILTVLREQNERRRVRRLHREHEGQG